VNPLRSGVRRLLEGIDVFYRRAQRLTPVGPVLFLGVEPLHEATVALANGTRLERGTPIGHLHFNNARAAAIPAVNRVQNGVRFARLLRHSLRDLAMRARDDVALRDVPLYEGITWFAPHGDAVGFESDPIPHGWRRRLLQAHFRLLLWAFSPTADRRALGEVAPRRFRISRDALIGSFAARS
jgi:hypothetical protein